MTRTITHKPDPKLDLVLERVVDVPPNLVWAAWTTPEYVKKWFTPAPWQTVDCEIDLRPGGIFRFVMRSPEGQDFNNIGCYLEVIENEKLVWTAALKPGYRPQNPPGVPLFTAVILLEPHGAGTKYTAIAIHGDEESTKKHAAPPWASTTVGAKPSTNSSPSQRRCECAGSAVRQYKSALLQERDHVYALGLSYPGVSFAGVRFVGRASDTAGRSDSGAGGLVANPICRRKSMQDPRLSGRRRRFCPMRQDDDGPEKATASLLLLPES